MSDDQLCHSTTLLMMRNGEHLGTGAGTHSKNMKKKNIFKHIFHMYMMHKISLEVKQANN